MASTRIFITIDRKLIVRLDSLVEQKHFPNRSAAVQEALRDQLRCIKRARLARECAKLDPQIEQELAEEGFDWEVEKSSEY